MAWVKHDKCCSICIQSKAFCVLSKLQYQRYQHQLNKLIQVTTMIADMVELKVTSDGGKVERSIVAQESITVYNLHKVLQFCLFPSKSDDAIAATAYEFKQGSKALKNTKTTKLHQAAAEGCKVGTKLTYKSCGVSYTVEVVDTATGDVRNWVPRCIAGCGGNLNLDKTNKKLIKRRFNATSNRLGFKQYPGFWCDASITTAEDMMGFYMSAMREPLHNRRTD